MKNLLFITFVALSFKGKAETSSDTNNNSDTGYHTFSWGLQSGENKFSPFYKDYEGRGLLLAYDYRKKEGFNFFSDLNVLTGTAEVDQLPISGVAMDPSSNSLNLSFGYALNIETPLHIIPFLGLRSYSAKSEGNNNIAKVSLELNLTGIELGTYLEYLITDGLVARLRLSINNISPKIILKSTNGVTEYVAESDDFESTTIIPLALSLFYQYTETWGFHLKAERATRKVRSTVPIYNTTEFDLSGSSVTLGTYHLF